MDPSEIATHFVQTYYQTFDTNRAGFGSLYCPDSKLTFEGHTVVGPGDIVQKLTALPLQVVQHVTTTIDAQMTPDNGLLVFVVGQLKTDSDHPHGFSQVFHLKQIGDSLFVLNDMFRLTLHHS